MLAPIAGAGPQRQLLHCFSTPVTQAFSGDEQERNKENSENRGEDHAAEHGRADRTARGGSSTVGNDQRKQPEDEGEAGHHHRPES